MLQIARYLGRKMANVLNQPLRTYEQHAFHDEEVLRAILQPGDVILVEGDRRISVAIKFLTQSTWSHAGMYIGDLLRQEGNTPQNDLIEADIERGVVAVPLNKYINHNIRICRAVGLTETDRRQVIEYVVGNLGHTYDLKNVFDLLRYFLPLPPVPLRFRRRLLAFGSGDPTRGICSTLLAQAFQSVRYPILPRRGFQCVSDASEVTDDEILHARHYSHFTPRDFDLSPYFAVIKPTVEGGFDYRDLKWQEDFVRSDDTPPTKLHSN